ncbi:hypothetical protein EG240_04495 [Paenimyroides tangerinum]|uniref:Uncharacterized protein n=1 Tax=Paenimyroides tangerinum TaxID=2488728 RepID=A0A3P3W9I3_9FLAO|nr:hypothetical protein [Paenimyroides tangerinum]RRJ91822.1 hypothetical protein EG240_04495 [Paenimyroides tangerinum]
MKHLKFIFLLLLIVCFSCKEQEKQTETSYLPNYEYNNNIEDNSNLINKSFVFSCGSGCAMRYSVENIQFKEQIATVKFKIETFIDEELSETFQESYDFIYDSKNNITKVLNKDNQNVLETLPNGAKESFIEFSKLLLKSRS